jgi:hypothetical protein
VRWNKVSSGSVVTEGRLGGGVSDIASDLLCVSAMLCRRASCRRVLQSEWVDQSLSRAEDRVGSSQLAV